MRSIANRLGNVTEYAVVALTGSGPGRAAGAGACSRSRPGRTSWRWIILILMPTSPSMGRDLQVGDATTPTIAHAIKLAQPGDTIHLRSGESYPDYAGFYGKQGQPDRPITLDGHGATLEGSDPLDVRQWTEVGPGHFTCDRLPPVLNGAMLARWFFLFDGRMQRMGRVSKGRSAPFKSPEELQPGEWTFIPSHPASKDHSVAIEGTFHLRVAPGRSLVESNIRVPVRSAGVQFGGDNAHLVIRNLTATHPYNDGFNIHGDCRNVVFENIRAVECGDDGISAHESAQYEVKGFDSVGNATGICDTGTARTRYSDLFLADNVGYDLYFLDEVQADVERALVLSSAQNPLTTTGRAGGSDCRLSLEQVHFHRLIEPRVGRVAARSQLQARKCTFEGLTIDVTGAAEFQDCLLDGQPSDPGASGADRNLLERLRPAPDPHTSEPRR